MPTPEQKQKGGEKRMKQIPITIVGPMIKKNQTII